MKYRAGAFDARTKLHGKYTIVEAASAADAIMQVKPLFPGVPLPRFFAEAADPGSKIHSPPQLVSFHIPKKAKGAQ